MTSNLKCLSLGLLLATAACDAGSMTAPLPPTEGPQLSTPARLDLAPAIQVVDAGKTAAVSARVFGVGGRETPGATVEWISSDTTVVAVSAGGSLRAKAAGVATIIARSGSEQDTATVVVADARSLVLTAIGAGNAASGAVKVGQTVSVPVTLDLSRVSPDGNLGSLQFDLIYDAGVLDFESGVVGVSGVSAINEIEPGRVRFVFAAMENQQSSNLTLATLTFKVPSSSRSSAPGALRIEYAAPPTTTQLESYETPVTVAGSFHVVD
jgi:hypothetical protein